MYKVNLWDQKFGYYKHIRIRTTDFTSGQVKLKMALFSRIKKHD